jgi:hypothetical protein
VGGEATSLAYLPRPDRDEGGFAVLQLSRPEEHRYRLVARLHRRNALAAGERTAADDVEFELRTDARGAGSVVQIREPAAQANLVNSAVAAAVSEPFDDPSVRLRPK